MIESGTKKQNGNFTAIQNLNMMIGHGYSATKRPCWRKPRPIEPNTWVANKLNTELKIIVE